MCIDSSRPLVVGRYQIIRKQIIYAWLSNRFRRWLLLDWKDSVDVSRYNSFKSIYRKHTAIEELSQQIEEIMTTALLFFLLFSPKNTPILRSLKSLIHVEK